MPELIGLAMMIQLQSTSIKNKISYAKAQGLGGYFFWALSFDKNWTLARAASMAWDDN